MVWTLQDAKNRFSQVVEKALSEGPQSVSRHGKEAVMVVSHKDWARMLGDDRRLSDFFRESPLAGSGLDVERDESPPREVDLQGD